MVGEGLPDFIPKQSDDCGNRGMTIPFQPPQKRRLKSPNQCTPSSVWARVILHKYSKTWAAIKNCVHLLYTAVKNRGSFHQNTAIPQGPACFYHPSISMESCHLGFFPWTLRWGEWPWLRFVDTYMVYFAIRTSAWWSMIFQKSTKSESICVEKTTSPWVLLLLRNNSDMLLVVVECPPFFAATLMSGMHKMNAWQDQWLKGLAF